MAVILSLTHLLNIAYAGTVSRYLDPAEFRRIQTPTSAVQPTLAEGVLSQSPSLYSYIQLENEFSSEFADALIEELESLERLMEKEGQEGFRRALRRALETVRGRLQVGPRPRLPGVREVIPLGVDEEEARRYAPTETTTHIAIDPAASLVLMRGDQLLVGRDAWPHHRRDAVPFPRLSTAPCLPTKKRETEPRRRFRHARGKVWLAWRGFVAVFKDLT